MSVNKISSLKNMDQYKIWDVMSYAWTEIGLESEDYPKYAKKIKQDYPDWEKVNKIIVRDVCASFAVDSFLIFPCMLWMIMPDWCYDEEYLKARMKKWYAKPYWSHFINPIRILGYPISIIFTLGVRRKLKKAYENT
ncbi:hypothetical protein [Kangiella aquimarina]|uniref:Uncharacterized protein n=1 Tax=Kangiella aquimarina TaxID=261965 RepID=A0ABZ0X4R9_9GAMM|nr:hypothetical protein [Kangiella aquimarina]WQG85597.1 hypothetical protein SR900_01635 [Kangiella aquimarina]